MKVGLLGAGTIGYGVCEIIGKTPGIEIAKVLDRRDIPGLEGKLTRNIEDILGDSSIDAVVELLGGVEPARTWAVSAMEAGKHFVTANKLMVSENLSALRAVAEKNGVTMRFSAAVGGGIPFLFNLIRARRVDEINEVGGILNGTTNYMLDLMQTQGVSFEKALSLAQEAGYAERDPSADISGGDAKSKIMLAASIAWNAACNKEKILCEGIESIKVSDMDYIREKGYACKLLARAAKVDGGICCYVEPSVVAASTVTANIALVENMAYFRGANAGLQRFTGAGAGRYATAYAVVEDLLDIRDNRDAFAFSVSEDNLEIDNAAETHQYISRGVFSDELTISEEMSVLRMHEMAASARKAGKEVFFAGIIG